MNISINYGEAYPVFSFTTVPEDYTVDVPDDVVARWRTVLDQYVEVQSEMAEYHSKIRRQEIAAVYQPNPLWPGAAYTLFVDQESIVALADIRELADIDTLVEMNDDMIIINTHRDKRDKLHKQLIDANYHTTNYCGTLRVRGWINK